MFLRYGGVCVCFSNLRNEKEKGWLGEGLEDLRPLPWDVVTRYQCKLVCFLFVTVVFGPAACVYVPVLASALLLCLFSLEFKPVVREQPKLIIT